MREIKFRVWDKTTRRMYAVMSITLNAVNGNIRKVGLIRIGENGRLDKRQKFYRQVGEVGLMQYTGLKDKNGREIYEGDILQDDLFSSRDVVKFGEYWETPEGGAYGWYKKSANHHDLVSSLITGIAVSEVIGNIYENPELLNDNA